LPGTRCGCAGSLALPCDAAPESHHGNSECCHCCPPPPDRTRWTRRCQTRCT
jgi:hypothetical protein